MKSKGVSQFLGSGGGRTAYKDLQAGSPGSLQTPEKAASGSLLAGWRAGGMVLPIGGREWGVWRVAPGSGFCGAGGETRSGQNFSEWKKLLYVKEFSSTHIKNACCGEHFP